MKKEVIFSFIYRLIMISLVSAVIFIFVMEWPISLKVIRFYVILSLFLVWLTLILWAISDLFPKKFPSWNKQFTVFVPVKNENPQRFNKVLVAIVRSYGEKQIIVGSDGSTKENLLEYNKIIKNLKSEYNKIELSLIAFKSLGKIIVQSKLHKLAKYDIIVNVDSDVLVQKKAFIRLLAPFYDENVGITNGRLIIRSTKRLIDKYYNVLYLCANQIGRKSMGRFGLMPCASGELLAYRKDILDKKLTEYAHAKFLWGIPITFGEDRLLTNIILKDGYKSIYCEDSVGVTWGKYSLLGCLKQQLRWRRSWIRESIRACLFSWNTPLLFINVFLNLVLPILFAIIVISLFIRIIFLFDIISLLSLIFIIILTTIIRDLPLLFEEKQITINLTIYSVFSLLFITPLWLYALFTVDYIGWGSRN